MSAIEIQRLRESCKALRLHLQSERPDCIKILRQRFNELDSDGDGTIDKKELRRYCHQYDLSSSALMTIFDEDNNGALDFDEMIMLFMFIQYKDTITVGCDVCDKDLFPALDPTFCACADCFDEVSGCVAHNCCGSNTGMYVVCLDCVRRGKRGYNHGRNGFRLVQNKFDQCQRACGVVSQSMTFGNIMTATATSIGAAGTCTYSSITNEVVREASRDAFMEGAKEGIIQYNAGESAAEIIAESASAAAEEFATEVIIGGAMALGAAACNIM